MLRTTLLLATFILLLPAAAAAPTEAHPDCEATQPWIGYRSSDGARAAYEGQGSPGALALCEGEHWDGQDSISSASSSCTVPTLPDASAPHASFCLGSDPNTAVGDNPLTPGGARVSMEDGAAYVGFNVALVARGAVYADEGTAALYARDNTPGNIIVTIIECCRITGPTPSENDCDQATYQAAAYNGDRRCGRDNTAITLHHALLA